MQAIVALFSEESAQKIYRIWDCVTVNQVFSREGVIPHISWHVAEQYPLEEIKTFIDSETYRTPRFTVISSGLGIFRDSTSYLYLPVTATEKLIQQHKRIFKSVSELCVDCNDHYRPDIWVPHITIQFLPLTKDHLCQSLQDVWENIGVLRLEVESFGLIDSSTRNLGIVYQSMLKG